MLLDALTASKRDDAETDFGGMATSLGQAYPVVRGRAWGGDAFELRPVSLVQVPTQPVAGGHQFTLPDATLTYRHVSSIVMPTGPDFSPSNGAMRVDFEIPVKPASNLFSLRLDLSQGVTLEWQDETPPTEPWQTLLTGDTWPANAPPGSVWRPPWCRGSYTVIAADGRKLGHIPRPFAVDRDGKIVWGMLHWDGSVLTKEIPWSFLNPAVYPVIIDDTFGYTSIGGTTSATSQYWVYGYGQGSAASPQGYTPASDGNAASISTYLAKKGGPEDVTLGIYSDSSNKPSSLLRDTGGGGTGNAGWHLQNLDSALAVSNGTYYWPCLQGNDPIDTYWDSSPTGCWYYADGEVSYTSGTMPASPTFWKAGSSYRFSIYVTYTPTAAVDLLMLPAAKHGNKRSRRHGHKQ